MKCIELIGVKVNLGKYVVKIIATYRPPNTNPSDTIHDIDQLLKNLGNGNVVIAGDLNINLAKQTNITSDYENLLLSYGLIQHVKMFTRITKNSATLIDHCISNMNDLNAMVIHEMCADHQTILSTFGEKDISKQNSSKAVSTVDRVHMDKTIENLKKVDWKLWDEQTKNLNIDDTYDSFQNIIKNSLELQKVKSRKMKPLKNWMTTNLLMQRLEVAKARKKFYKSRTEANENLYKSMNKEYRKDVNTAKSVYYTNRLRKAGKDSRLIWTVIKEVLNRKSKDETHKSIMHNNIEVTNKLEIANCFSEHYKNAAVDKIKALNSSMNFEQFLNKEEEMKNTFQLKEISRMETWFYIKSVKPKNSQGFDGIPSRLMNLAANMLVVPMTHIINKCFKDGSFPNALKTAKICPIDKKKGIPGPAGFRPVSLLSPFSKVIEKAAADQLQNHLTKNVENERQFAYKPKHSCVHAILLTRHLIEAELEKGNYVALVLIDLSLAFDTVECSKILPEKLKHYGATKNTVAFFKSFFTERKLYTVWDGVNSKKVDLYNYSCVQGSCLGPLIFNTYSNDLRHNTESELVGFADDTNIIRSDKNPNNLIRTMNKDLTNIQSYMTENTLMLNKSKSYFMIFKPKGGKTIPITEKMHINNTEIERVKVTRFLGIWIDKD